MLVDTLTVVKRKCAAVLRCKLSAVLKKTALTYGMYISKRALEVGVQPLPALVPVSLTKYGGARLRVFL